MRLELTTLISHAISIKINFKCCLCEARTHDLHVTARRSTTQKLPPYHGGPKETNFQHHTNGHLEDTTMWGSLRLAPIICIMLLLFPVPCVYVKYNNTELKLSYTLAENTTIFHHSWSGGWVCWMCIGWSIRVHHFTVCKQFCPIYFLLFSERAYDYLHQHASSSWSVTSCLKYTHGCECMTITCCKMIKQICTSLCLCIYSRKLWLTILAWGVIGIGTAFAIVPIYSDMYGIAKWVSILWYQEWSVYVCDCMRGEAQVELY